MCLQVSLFFLDLQFLNVMSLMVNVDYPDNVNDDPDNVNDNPDNVNDDGKLTMCACLPLLS